DGENAVFNWQVLAREDQMHAGMRERAGDIDLADAGMRMRRAQQFTVKHPRKNDVVSVASLAGNFGASIDTPARLADDLEVIRLSGVAVGCASVWRICFVCHRRCRSQAGQAADLFLFCSAISSTAASTASKICR